MRWKPFLIDVLVIGPLQFGAAYLAVWLLQKFVQDAMIRDLGIVSCLLAIIVATPVLVIKAPWRRAEPIEVAHPAPDFDVADIRSKQPTQTLPVATRAELAQPIIENRLVRIHEVPRSEHNDTIFGKTFRNCVIEGPAIVAARGRTKWDQPDFGYEGDPESIVWRHSYGTVVGVIVLTHCDFYRCQTHGIGLLMMDEEADAFLRTVRRLVPDNQEPQTDRGG